MRSTSTEEEKMMRYSLLFIIFFLVSCSIFKIRSSTDDTLLDFYNEEPAAYTQTSLRVTENARESIHARRYDDAVEQLNKALSIDPHNPFAYYFLGICYYEKKEHKRSNHFLEKAEQLFSSSKMIDGKLWKTKIHELRSLNQEKLRNL